VTGTGAERTSGEVYGEPLVGIASAERPNAPPAPTSMRQVRIGGPQTNPSPTCDQSAQIQNHAPIDPTQRRSTSWEETAAGLTRRWEYHDSGWRFDTAAKPPRSVRSRETAFLHSLGSLERTSIKGRLRHRLVVFTKPSRSVHDFCSSKLSVSMSASEPRLFSVLATL